MRSHYCGLNIKKELQLQPVGGRHQQHLVLQPLSFILYTYKLHREKELVVDHLATHIATGNLFSPSVSFSVASNKNSCVQHEKDYAAFEKTRVPFVGCVHPLQGCKATTTTCFVVASPHTRPFIFFSKKRPEKPRPPFVAGL